MRNVITFTLACIAGFVLFPPLGAVFGAVGWYLVKRMNELEKTSKK